LWLAIGLRVAVFVHIAVVFHTAATSNHHVAVFHFGDASHATGHLLEAQAIGGTNVDQKVDVGTCGHAAVQVTRQDALLLLLAHGPFIQINPLVGLDAHAVLGLYQTHAEWFMW